MCDDEKDCLAQSKMQIAVLTAAVQEPIPREEFGSDPIKAAMDSTRIWIQAIHEIGVAGGQWGAALARPDSYIPPEAMLDPVAPHIPIRTFKDGTGVDLSDESAEEIISLCGDDVKIFDLGFFENLLHKDPVIRKQVHEHLLRTARAAKRLEKVGCRGVTCFLGVNEDLSIDENLIMFEEEVIPLLKKIKEIGVKFWIEQCPMPGWGTSDLYIRNIAFCAGMWITIARIAEKYGLRDMIRITYDASHDILLGNTPYRSFRILNAAGYGDLIDRFHGKDQNRNLAKVAAWTMLGQRAGLGIRIRGKLVTDPNLFGKAWGRMTASHSMPGISAYNPWAQNEGLKVDWLAHQYYARALLGLDAAETVFILEHEWIPARDQNLARVKKMVGLSAQFITGVDAAADAIFRAKGWCEAEKLPWVTTTNPLEELVGLDDEVAAILAIPV